MRKQVTVSAVIVMAALAIAAVAFAADAGECPAKEFCKAVWTNLKADAAELGITQAQETQFKAIAFSACAESVGVAKSDLAWGEKEKQLLAIGEKTRQQVLAQLSPEQKAKMTNIPIAQLFLKPQEAEGMVVAYLGLTPDQKKEGEAIIGNAKLKAAAILNDASLNDEQRRAQWMQIAADALEKGFALLTPEQKQKAINAFKYGG